MLRTAPNEISGFTMFKVTPNPPESAPASPYESPDFKSFHEADDRALDHYLGPAQIMVSTNQLIRMYVSNPKFGSESLLANDSETIGSASEVLINLAAMLDTSQCKTAIGITQVLILGELAVNEGLDNVKIDNRSPTVTKGNLRPTRR